MNVLVIIGHQRLDSYCHALAEAAIEEFCNTRHKVTCHDLYAEAFDAVLPHDEVQKGRQPNEVIARHCQELLDADVILIVHPNWWSMPPAIVKGWVDRVFRAGVAYEFGPAGKIGKLEGKRAIVLTTSNTPAEDDLRLYGDPLETLWKDCIFGFCGVTDFYRRNFASLITCKQEQRDAWLEEIRATVRERYASTPLPIAAWLSFDEQAISLTGV